MLLPEHGATDNPNGRWQGTCKMRMQAVFCSTSAPTLPKAAGQGQACVAMQGSQLLRLRYGGMQGQAEGNGVICSGRRGPWL